MGFLARSVFTSVVPALFDGISIIVITVGILALGEVLFQVYDANRPKPDLESARIKGSAYLSWQDFKEALPAWLRGTGFGLPFGVIPVGGAEVPTFMAYATERKLDSRSAKPKFGTGAIRGVAAPEAAGNATAGTAMGALLAMGLPTSATAAIMLAAFQQYGIQPGPLLFDRNADLVWPLLASLFIGLVVLLILNLPLAPMWAKLLLIPKHYLYAGIAVFCALGVYATSASTTDLALVLVIGVIGFLFRKFDFPLAPVMIGVILGPLAETSFRNASLSSGGDYTVLIASPITWVMYGLMVIVLGAATFKHFNARARKASDPAQIVTS